MRVVTVQRVVLASVLFGFVGTASVSAQGRQGPEPFVQAGVGMLDRPRAFDRKTPATGKGPAVLLGGGVSLGISDTVSLAGSWLRAVDVNDDGADVEFFLGEMRQRLDDIRGAWVGIGGGRVRGTGRKESWVQTLSFGRDFGRGTFGELRWITDEGDGRILTLGLGWKLGGRR